MTATLAFFVGQRDFFFSAKARLYQRGHPMRLYHLCRVCACLLAIDLASAHSHNDDGMESSCPCSMTGEWRYFGVNSLHEEFYSATQLPDSDTFTVERDGPEGSWKTASGTNDADCHISISFHPGPNNTGLLDATSCRVITWADSRCTCD